MSVTCNYRPCIYIIMYCFKNMSVSVLSICGDTANNPSCRVPFPLCGSRSHLTLLTEDFLWDF
jgi:hypothetical protein